MAGFGRKMNFFQKSLLTVWKDLFYVHLVQISASQVFYIGQIWAGPTRVHPKILHFCHLERVSKLGIKSENIFFCDLL